MRPYIIGISGGIGSGKSVVSRILRIWGYPVYDCDTEAKALMDADAVIKQRLVEDLNADVVSAGCIDRVRLAEIVFADDAKLSILNSIVHTAVRRHFAQWASRQCRDIIFVETAILHSSGMVEDVDAEWRVTAPVDIRVARVMRRNNTTVQQVRSRIAVQQADEGALARQMPLIIIENDGQKALLPQIITALNNK